MSGFASPSFFPSTAGDFEEDYEEDKLFSMRHVVDWVTKYREMPYTYTFSFSPSSTTHWFTIETKLDIPEFSHQDRPMPSNRSGGCAGFQRGRKQTNVRPMSPVPVILGRSVRGRKKLLKTIKRPP